MRWLYHYRNAPYVQILFVAAILEAISAKHYGKWMLRRRASENF